MKSNKAKISEFLNHNVCSSSLIEPKEHDHPILILRVSLRKVGRVNDPGVLGYPNNPGTLFAYRIATIWTF